MSGLKLTIPTTFTDTSLPYLRDDAVLPKQGALMLVDPMHPAGAWAAGVPTDGALLPNLAEDQLSALLTAPVAADLSPKMVNPAAFTGAAGLLERTAKGGLHAITSQSGAAVVQSGPALAFSTKLMKYILDNSQHDYYMSMWARLTRIPVAGYNNSSMVVLNGSGQQTNSYLFNVAPTGSTGSNYTRRPAAAPPQLGIHEDPAGSAVGNKFFSLATEGWKSNTIAESIPGDGTNTSVTGTQAGGGLTWGPTKPFPGIGATGTVADGVFNPPGSATPGTNKDKTDSHIIYRFYLEDLTVSGRSYATVDALSWAEYQKHVLTVGGRYYSDTFTDPATLP